MSPFPLSETKTSLTEMQVKSIYKQKQIFNALENIGSMQSL